MIGWLNLAKNACWRTMYIVYSEIVVLIEVPSMDLCILNVKEKLPKCAAGCIASHIFQKEHNCWLRTWPYRLQMKNRVLQPTSIDMLSPRDLEKFRLVPYFDSPWGALIVGDPKHMVYS